MTRCSVTTRPVEYAVGGEHGLRTRGLTLGGGPDWSVEGSGPVFTVVVDGVTVTGTSDGLEVDRASTGPGPTGVPVETTHCTYATEGLALGIDWHVVRYPDLPLVETWVSVTNHGDHPVTVERLDSVGLTLPPASYDLLSYTSGWGLEFEATREPLQGSRTIGTLAGRSSQGMHPSFALFRDDGAVMYGTVAWSGNWVLRFEEGAGGGHVLTGGLRDEGFAKVLEPAASVAAPPVVLALGDAGDLDTTSTALARAARAYWAPRNELTDELPVEWNHWWTYEDHSIDEATFRANVDVAVGLGVDVCTLDAGWFGPADASSHWGEVRGDWDLVNSVRFPSGIRALADYVHGHGMRFGLWCEIEALGPKATLAERHPDFPAVRDGKLLGYVCLANPAARQWAYATLDRLVREDGADWIKLDFNLDPGLGCNRTDHGHGEGDGLFEHYLGYYQVLDRIRAEHPALVLENCSSGGLRIDLGILRHTHLTFLSDPDWPEHGLQLVWGATTMLPASQLLHWGYSEWFGDHRHQSFDPRDPTLAPHQLDYYRRIAMVGATGFSLGLPGLPDPVRERLATQVRTYKDVVRPFVRAADLHRLTEAPRRFGEGARWAALQYARPDGSEHLVLVFRLPGGADSDRIRLHALDPARDYDVRWHDADRVEVVSGAVLMDAGLDVALPEEGSEILVVRSRHP